MRQIALCLLVLSSCAPAAAPASRPVAFAPAMALDAQGVRELLAGVELELGDERAKTADAEQRVEAARTHTIIAGAFGFLFGALLTVFVTFGVNR